MRILFKMTFTLCIIMCFFVGSLVGQEASTLEGRWDLTIQKDGKELPSWLEIKHSGRNTLVGRFVYAFGSARPISEVQVEGANFRFSIPPQWEPGTSDMIFIGSYKDEELSGTMIYTDGSTSNWVGRKSPELVYNNHPKWGKPIELFNGSDLTGWHADRENQWVVKDRILISPKSGANLITDQEFMNFKLHAEFRYPEGSNSGIYLRGRYELQITDSKGMAPSDTQLGAIYGFIEPNMMAAKAPGEWQTYDVTLIGNRISVVANGHNIITDQIIPGITGGALNSDQGATGPFFIQGDHGPIEIRKFTVTPMLD